ncbi:MAG: hypothetical protein PHE18_01400 [Candidatus Omnitrophica bacterium]|nr:hypothetical protein [Candidatus Omnitrophota bacterium]MDD5552511.1 hypothetical protein [Candidatus Omnitrophota bacterium]
MRHLFGYIFSECGPLGNYKKCAAEIFKKHSGRAYAYAVGVLRTAFFSLAGLGLALILASWAFIFFPIAILTFLPWDWKLKVTLSLFITFLYLLAAGILFFVTFSQKRWMKAYRAAQSSDKS